MKKTDKTQILLLFKMLIANGLIIYLAAYFYPGSVVLGNASLSSMAALTVTAILLTLIISQVEPLLKLAKVRLKGDFAMAIVYGLVNIIGLWIIARTAIYTGFGISTVSVAVILGVVLNLAQYFVWKLVMGKK
ncbi:hypothetical protein A3D03_02170 [Candidatus Gottesmanbacteria bacterium RIFCSPHIGHO2_02_FULL_40_13]|uniref:Uncharacterized protein n=1 Tax=Candidatus Gottesmanbacteria bacterium RIFCSPHIGHO2_02_FULL_40_13 TaxID=1798384 RepID=A0A1F6AB16_9BACT|nr:MAG: hypothetical protein A3D03_02170 [Candidatus Gottesmanbacteria bacterium RIFCSPHIGHO2_02_FULL_40_13]